MRRTAAWERCAFFSTVWNRADAAVVCIQGDYHERVGKVLSSLTRIREVIGVVQDSMREFPPSVLFAELMHVKWVCVLGHLILAVLL